MFEFSIARKYLIPRWRQLSVSLISMISVMVIAVVVWLIVVFFSVTNGLESIWTDKMIALTSPIQITPTSEYYHSYYYLIDGVSDASNYRYKTIHEKLASEVPDPYDPEFDREIPSDWPDPDLHPDGGLRDPVKEAHSVIEELTRDYQGLQASDFEIAFANVSIQMNRGQSLDSTTQELNHAVYLGSLDEGNRDLITTLQPVTGDDLENMIQRFGLPTDSQGKKTGQRSPIIFKQLVKELFEDVDIHSLTSPAQGWRWPTSALPKKGSLRAVIMFQGKKPVQAIVPQSTKGINAILNELTHAHFTVKSGSLQFDGDQIVLKLKDNEKSVRLPRQFPVVIERGATFQGTIEPSSIVKANRPEDLKWSIEGEIQGSSIATIAPYTQLNIESFTLANKGSSPLWLRHQADRIEIPIDQGLGEAIVVPKTFRDAGVKLGDPGFINYYAGSASGASEQQLPVYVSGFFDFGVLPMGGKFVLANRGVTSLLRSTYGNGELTSTGFHVRYDHLEDTDPLKDAIVAELKKKRIDRYWNVQSYKEYEYTKELFQQLQSEKNLFSLIAAVIIIVACSNIVSMLIILVNDKKLEIGILRSMGAGSSNIALIFGLCGFSMGFLGSSIGVSIAYFTLKNIHSLLGFISYIQGHEVLSSAFFGDTLPTEISSEALLFVLIATTTTSLLAGLIPAIKASMLKPAAILRSE